MSTSNDPDSWTLHKRVVTKEMPDFEGICMQFEFKIQKPGSDQTQLIFAR